MLCGGSIRESPTNHHRRTRRKPLRSSVIRLPFNFILRGCLTFVGAARRGSNHMSEWVASIMTSGVDWLWSQRTRILLLATVMQRASPSGGEKGSTKKRGMHCSASTLTLGLGCVSIRQSLWLAGLFWVHAGRSTLLDWSGRVVMKGARTRNQRRDVPTSANRQGRCTRASAACCNRR